MHIEVKSGAPLSLPAEALVVAVYEDEPHLEPVVRELDEAIGGRIQTVLDARIFEPSLNETFPLVLEKGRRIVVVGLGKRGELKPDHVRQAAGTGARVARELKARDVALVGFALEPEAMLVQAQVEGAVLGLYQFLEGKGRGTEKLPDQVTRLTVLRPKITLEAKQGLRAGEVIADAVNWARDLSNRPADVLTPRAWAAETEQMAQPRGMRVRLLGRKELEKEGLGYILAVGKGAEAEPMLIIIEYHGGKKGEKPVALVGKGVTFDCGGLCIKPGEGMDEMKTDMAGGAAVLGAIRALADLRAPVNVVALVPAVENMVGGGAYHPGDILRGYRGLTLEVVDTDAEGRIVLADALAYADRNYDPVVTLDLATLTGSIMVALNHEATGLFTRDEALRDRLMAAAEASAERCWPMPMWEDYHELVESDVADLKNSDKRRGDAIGAAMLLGHFPGDRPWAHLDIAGPAWLTSERPYEPKYATGHGVRLLVELLRDGYRA